MGSSWPLSNIKCWFLCTYFFTIIYYICYFSSFFISQIVPRQKYQVPVRTSKCYIFYLNPFTRSKITLLRTETQLVNYSAGLSARLPLKAVRQASRHYASPPLKVSLVNLFPKRNFSLFGWQIFVLVYSIKFCNLQNEIKMQRSWEG